jgi:phosphonate transport system substrate-binding protein
MFATLTRGTVIAALALTAMSTTATAQDWQSEVSAFRIGLLGGENEADRLRRNECMVEQLGEVLGVPIELSSHKALHHPGIVRGGVKLDRYAKHFAELFDHALVTA